MISVAAFVLFLDSHFWSVFELLMLVLACFLVASRCWNLHFVELIMLGLLLLFTGALHAACGLLSQSIATVQFHTCFLVVACHIRFHTSWFGP